MSSQILQHYALHINYDSQTIAFEGEDVIETPIQDDVLDNMPVWALILIALLGLAVAGMVTCYCVIRKRRNLRKELNTYSEI